MRDEDSNNLDGSMESSVFTAEKSKRVHLLCTFLLDDVISDNDLSELNQLLAAHEEARSLYLKYAMLSSTLLGTVSKSRDVLAERLAEHVDAFDSSPDEANFSLAELPDQDADSPTPIPAPVSGLPQQLWSSPIGWVATTGLILAATFFCWNSYAPSKQQEPQQVASDAAPQLDPQNRQEKHHELQSIKVSYTSSASVWKTSSDRPSSDSIVETGSVLRLKEGEVELTYPCGTKLLLIGPAEFDVADTGGKLVRGDLVASVTDAGHGFTIDMPNGKVVDLGTEFGVTVDDFGVSGVSVFKGKVEAFPLKDGETTEKIELNKGDGLQWDNSAVVSLKADLRKFASSVLGRQLSGTKVESKNNVTDSFKTRELDSSKWITLGDVKMEDESLVLRGQGDSATRPYLICSQQIDPLLGPVTATCDVRFGDSVSNASPLFSILTRSAADRGSYGLEPSVGSLASYVRCSFGSNEPNADGLMSAAVKLETDTQMDGLLLDSFHRPKTGERYRIVMRDDGVNVTFTTSLIDNPDVSKTVTCRSLFRAKHNHIAFEGSCTGSTIIERVEITQDRSAATISSYAEFSTLLQTNPAQRAIEKRLLDDWTPDNAILLVQDNFGSQQLDSSKWRSLGELVPVSGAIQLGVHNHDQHIDTMHARPHLFTRDAISTKNGPLTVVGKVTFAENFLGGFGGSFAVVTRAGDKLGNGPGWENSVLQLGVRANFWPAAWNTKHNLEIHQKPSANTLTLLATQGVQVDPISRVYLFRVIDDGSKVSLTLLDPRKPDQLMVIESPTTVPMQEGHVAFESCWGSPVLLDDVRIYQEQTGSH